MKRKFSDLTEFTTTCQSINSWGYKPQELKKNGLTFYYGYNRNWRLLQARHITHLFSRIASPLVILPSNLMWFKKKKHIQFLSLLRATLGFNVIRNAFKNGYIKDIWNISTFSAAFYVLRCVSFKSPSLSTQSNNYPFF